MVFFITASQIVLSKISGFAWWAHALQERRCVRWKQLERFDCLDGHEYPCACHGLGFCLGQLWNPMDWPLLRHLRSTATGKSLPRHRFTEDLMVVV
jgi:hypothetical protein